MRYAVFAILALLTVGAKAESLPELKALSPFIGLWTATSGSVDGSNQFEDIAKWEWAFGGKVVRITHSVNKGAYAGESLIHWDAVTEKIIYRYVNTANFYTDGTITPLPDGSIEVHEFVRGSKSGPTESLSGYSLRDGQIVAWSKFKTDGVWEKPQEVTYSRTPDAKIVFQN